MYNYTVTENVTLCTIRANDIKEFQYLISLFAGEKINIDMISAALPQGHKHSFSFSFDDGDFNKALTIMKQLKDENFNSLPSISSGNSKIVVFGDEMSNEIGFAARLLDKIKAFDVLMITTAEKEISILTTKADESAIIKEIENLL